MYIVYGVLFYLWGNFYYLRMINLGDFWSGCMGVFGGCVVEVSCVVIKEKIKNIF